MVRGVIPCSKDDTGAIFLDRDAKHFQLVLNYLRDGWCLLPKGAEERRELLQEIRYYQLAGMEAWLRTQELLGEKPEYNYLNSPTSVLTTPGRSSMLSMDPFPLTNTPTAAESAFSRTSLTCFSPSAASLMMTGGAAPANLATARPSSPYLTQRTSFNEAIPQVRTSMVEQHMPTAARESIASRQLSTTLSVDEFKWTSKYLKTNEKLRECVNTLLELAYLPPHKSLHAGKVHISISVECDHDRITSLIGNSSDHLRNRYQVIQVKGAMGWSFECTLRPSSDLALFEKYNLADYMQDNWFVLSAVLKDQYAIVLEEDTSVRPTCAACRRSNLAFTMQKYY
eukprot:jgi/Chrzof1/8456/Cz03g11080.t1